MKSQPLHTGVLHRRDNARCLLVYIVTRQVCVDHVLTSDGRIERPSVEHISFDDFRVRRGVALQFASVAEIQHQLKVLVPPEHFDHPPGNLSSGTKYENFFSSLQQP